MVILVRLFLVTLLLFDNKLTIADDGATVSKKPVNVVENIVTPRGISKISYDKDKLQSLLLSASGEQLKNYGLIRIVNGNLDIIKDIDVIEPTVAMHSYTFKAL